jgi:hypothetical protein
MTELALDEDEGVSGGKPSRGGRVSEGVEGHVS